MSKKMMRGALTLGLALVASAGVACAEEEKPTADFTVAAMSQYIWRGFAFSDDSIVLQPSMTVGYSGFSANVWGNLDTDPYNNEEGESSSNWNETDLTLSYSHDVGPVNLTGGWIYYALDSAEDSQEFFLTAAMDVLLSPTLSVYRDTDYYPGWYISLGISHSIALSDKIAIDLGAKAGYLSADDASTYGEVSDGLESSEDAYNGFLDGVLSVSSSIPVTEYISVTPQLYYSFPLGSDASDLLALRNSGVTGGDDDDFIYGGISVSLSF